VPAHPTMKMKIVRALALALAVAVVIPGIVAAQWPVASRYSYVSQKFHDGHRGMDLAAPKGTKVVPITSGKVVFAGWKNNCGGYQVWVRHSSGRYTAYYHLSKEVTYAGAYVGTSKVIGYVGATGCASGPHVHVEVWTSVPWRAGSYRVNPWNYVMSGYWLPYRYR
jgi:murein DD-endopeptidase MepM/ murein hydrolase activator NlpD